MHSLVIPDPPVSADVPISAQDVETFRRWALNCLHLSPRQRLRLIAYIDTLNERTHA